MEEKKGFFNGDTRMFFLFGLVAGIALMSLVGGGLNLSFAKGNGGNNNNSPIVRTPTTPTADAPVPEATSKDHVRGNLNKAKVVLIEYSDIQCPYCGALHPTLQQLANDYGDDVAWVYRHFPLTSIHPEAAPAANAAECAGEQGKFWEFTDILFANQKSLNDAYYKQVAKDLKLKTGQFNDCVDSGKYDDLVAQQSLDGQAAGATGTPATFINGTLVSGAVPYESMATMIDQILGK